MRTVSNDTPTGAKTPGCIVVGVDGSDHSTVALDWAAAEAGRCGARLEVHTAYAPGYEFVTREEVQRGMQVLLDEASNRAARVAPGVKVEGFLHEDQAVNMLLEASEHADLLVVGTRGRGRFSELVLGSVSLHCVFQARCSVVIARGG